MPSPTPGEALEEQPSGGMLGIARLLPVTRCKKQREDRRLREKHSRVLSLFCEEDLEVLCPLCTEPPATRAVR